MSSFLNTFTCVVLTNVIFSVVQEKFPRKMEAGRSVVYRNKIYFAAYQSKQICYYSVENEIWNDLGKPMHYSNPGLAIINQCVASIGGRKKNP